MINYKIFSNNYNNKTGLGKQTISLIKQLKLRTKSRKTYEVLSKIIPIENLQSKKIFNRINRHLFNLLYFLIGTLSTLLSKDKLISMSVVSPINSHSVHFASCHLYALKKIYNNFLLRLILNPTNIFYVFLEFCHYKNKRSINIFLSEIEKKQFKEVYGLTKARSVVIRPKLDEKFYNPKKEMYNYGINFLNISHNFKIKGEHIINDISSSFPHYRFFIVGEKSNQLEKENIVHLGVHDISKFDFNKYNFFIYPSKLDSHSFSLEEGFINGLIPLSSKNVGFSEIFLKNKVLSNLVLNDSKWHQALKKFKNFNDNEMREIKKELLILREEWLNRNILHEFKEKGII
jgi:hypothetical protein